MGGSLRAMLWIALASILGCRSSAAPPTPTPKTCAANEVLTPDGTCQILGVPPDRCGVGFVSDGAGGCTAILPRDRCPEGSIAVPGDTSCRPIGVAACGDALASDGKGGCDALLPKDACPGGMLATPGETACHEVAPCGSGAFGDAPLGTSTIFVDQSAGAPGDGSKSAPFATIGEAIAAASSTTPSVIAIAAGSYVENLETNKPVRLHGRCPSKVEIVGKDGVASPVVTLSGAAEIHTLALRGGAGGLATSSNVTVDRLYVHDTRGDGIRFEYRGAGSTAKVTGTLVEAATHAGIYVAGVTATITGSVVRGTKVDASDVDRSAGVVVQTLGAKAVATLQRTLVEKNAPRGLFVTGGSLTVEESVIRDSLPDAADLAADGAGVVAAGKASEVTLRRSIVERNQTTGVRIAGATGVLDSSIVRDTVGRLSDGAGGMGIAAYDASSVAASLVVTHSVIERNLAAGVNVNGAKGTIEDSIVRDIASNLTAASAGGEGIIIGEDYATGIHASATIRGTLVDRCHEIGIFVYASTVVIEGSVVRGIKPETKGGTFGQGIQATDSSANKRRSDLTLRGSIVEENVEIGVYVDGSTGLVESCIVRDTFGRAPATGSGHGISVVTDINTDVFAELVVRGTIVERSQLAGIQAIGANLTVDACVVRDTTAGPKGEFGDGIDMSPHVTPARSYKALTTATVTASLISGNARAGVSVFGSTLTLSSTQLACNAIDLDVESVTVLGTPTAPTVDDGGKNVCGCSKTPPLELSCRASSNRLAPVPRPM